MSAYVVAEGGSCHDGSLTRAMGITKAAAECGASAIKWQYFHDVDLLAMRRRVPSAYREIYKRYAIPSGWLEALAVAAESVGVDFVCSTFVPSAVEVVAPFVRHFKVSSFESQCVDLLTAHEPFLSEDRWLIVSLGMGASMPAFNHLGVRTLLCTSCYPAPADALNLSRLHREFDGFSDHSFPTETWSGALAVTSAGLKERPFIIEAHIRLNDTDPANPDYPHAMTPSQFRAYVANIRYAERCLGDGKDTARVCESAMQEFKVKMS